MSKVAIIPARGGSKRIPRKNVRDFLGKPIIAYSIEAAVASNVFDEVMVSTDDEEIASIARSYGATIPFMRSNKNADDFASTVDVIEEVIEGYKFVGKKFAFACCLYPTAPLVSSQRIREGFELLSDGGYDTVLPIVRYSFPIWRALHVTNNRIGMIWPENTKKRSQDLPPAFHDAGQWYWFKPDQIVNGRQLWTDNTFGIEVREFEVQDIDNESDWIMAELKYEFKKKAGQK